MYPMILNWRVLLLGGASGTGKTALSYPLARRYGVSIVEVDDLVEALQAMTTPQQQPILHYWRTHPEAAAYPAERIVELQIAVARALRPGVEAVVANHVETGTPVIIEGDYLLPGPLPPGVRAVFVHEPDMAQLIENYRLREPSAGDQRTRAEVSARYGDWLATEAQRYGIPVLAARPWETALDRCEALLSDRAR
jgi:2-phosphoglycerate kinase